MSESKDKLQLRATLINILNTYRDVEKVNNKQLKKDIAKISKLKNKEYIFKTIVKEINKQKSLYCDICSIILLESFDNETFEKLCYDFLKNPKSDDEKKFLVLSLMKQKDIDFNYREAMQYIDDPDAIAHNGIKSFLENAILDPEVQIDLLDFYLNIPTNEKICFLENLKTEFSGNDSANAFSILAQLNQEKKEEKIILETLLNTDSKYALEGLKAILEKQTLDAKTKSKTKRIIKKIEEKNPNYINKIFSSQGKADRCFIGFVDGKSNFPLVLSRKRKDKTIDALLLTANISKGLTSCMGFCSIPNENFELIVKRLFMDSAPIKIKPDTLKALYDHYINKSKKNNTELPYELIVWKNMLNDIKTPEEDISEHINKNLERTTLNKAKVHKFMSSKILETWYFSAGENKYIDKLIENIEKNHLTNLKEIDKLSSKTIDNYFISNKEFLIELQSKLLIQSYIANLAKLKVTSSIAYSMCFEPKYYRTLIETTIDKSLYYAFSTKLYKLNEKNIFDKNSKTNFTKEELESIMTQLEEKWS